MAGRKKAALHNHHAQIHAGDWVLPTGLILIHEHFGMMLKSHWNLFGPHLNIPQKVAITAFKNKQKLIWLKNQEAKDHCFSSRDLIKLDCNDVELLEILFG